MASTSTDIGNMSLGHLGSGVEMSNMETDRTNEARVMRKFYDVARRETLRDFDWPIATRYADLGLVEENPTDEWLYSYSYPSDCLKLRRILSGIRRDARETRVPYRLANDADAGTVIFTDQDSATAEYTVDLTDESLYPDDLANAISLKLAGYASAQLAAGDKFKIRSEMLQLYSLAIANARGNAGIEEHTDLEPDSEFIRCRE